jgi:hypothetical protein
MSDTPRNMDQNQNIALSRLALLWRKIFGPKPQAPCKYCGEMTDNENPFCPGLFAHRWCRDEAWAAQKRQAEERKKIELIKIAIRELEEEKHNAQDQTREPKTSI